MNSYIAIRSEGGLIPLETIDRIVREELPGQAAANFGLEKGRRLSDEIARAWSDALDYWHIFRRRMEALPESDPGTTFTRERWVLPLLTDLLGYELTYQVAGAQIGGKTYPISHRAGAGEEAPPVHIVGFHQDLDRRDESGHRRMSPHALVQEYVNRTEHLWAAVTNGLRFRLLRDTTRTARPTYLEFDLQSVLDAGRFNEFAIFYRLCHRTRLPETVADAKDCLLEQYFQASIDEGLRIRDRLRDAVEDALTCVGRGLLQHSGNDALRHKIASGQLTPETYYRQLLRMVYRLLFLMVAEERQMLSVPGADAERRQRIYDRFYSLRRLRDLAERPIEDTLYDDVWTGLAATFGLFTNGRENPLGMPPLNGHLFGPEAIPDLEETHLSNRDLLVAVRRMSVFEADGAPTRVNYAGLDVEELGAVYESLLEFRPTIERRNGGLVFELKTGTERKSTGSYYTPRELVSELIGSALVPVLEDRLAQAKAEEKEEAILTMTVCDPACGSGHFLLAAARRMARELARVRSGEDEPTPEEFRRALRDVIQHCVYGVDKNPLAVDLCKVALWIEGHNPGLPLSFLDHRIKCGDSLIGVFSVEKLAEGIPDDAYSPVSGDDKEVARALRRQNAKERKSVGRQMPLTDQQLQEHVRGHAVAYSALAALPQKTVEHVHAMERRYREIHGEGSSWWRDWVAANVWTSAFFVQLTAGTESVALTTDLVRDQLAGIALPAPLVDAVNARALDLRFFHWPLEYPEVFAQGGFHVVVSNPPWERMKLQEEEFFAPREPAIAKAPNKAARERLINQLAARNPFLHHEFEQAKHDAEAQTRFVRHSRRYPLTAAGDVNTYALFAELSRHLLSDLGRTGLIVPNGLVTEATTKAFFGDLVQTRSLVQFLGMDNEAMLFPGIDHRNRFGLLTVAKQGAVDAPAFTFFCSRPEWLSDGRRRFRLTPDEISLINPNSLTCPVFRTQADAELSLKIYKRVPVLVDERRGSNPWQVAFLSMFHMTNDSHLFRTRERLASASYHQAGNRFAKTRDVYLPLYEAKMFHQYDHRWGDFGASSEAQMREGSLAQPTPEQRRNSSFAILPRYWVPESEVKGRLSSWRHGWLFAFRAIASANLERTLVFAILPHAATGNSAPLILSGLGRAPLFACLLACLNSIVLDYCARQKIGGVNVNFFYVEQLPVLPPTAYGPEDVAFLTQRTLELTYTASDLEEFARDLNYEGPPFVWDRDRRALLRAEVDACIAHLYGLDRDELRYILDPQDVHGGGFPGETFRVLKERESKEHGEYSTRRLVLDAYDELAKTRRFGGRLTVTIPHGPLRKDG